MKGETMKITYEYGNEKIVVEWKGMPHNLDCFMSIVQRFIYMSEFNKKEVDTYISQWGDDIVRKYEKSQDDDND